MPPRLWRERIADILDAIDAIRSHTDGLTEVEFCTSRLVGDAVERNFAVIGEAVVTIPQDVQDRHPEIPWSLMRRMRNFVVHVYFAVKRERLWATIQHDLAPTAVLLMALLGQEAEDDQRSTGG